MDVEVLRRTIRKHTLANAVKFNGKANPGAVISKIIGEMPEAKSDMKFLSIEVNNIVKRINAQPTDISVKEIEDEFPEMLEKKEKEERNIFAFFGITDGDRIITAYPPGPEKYPHIGHAKACLLNYLLAQKYGGKFVLRFEDTNPRLVKNEFYDIIKDNLWWVGARWDELICASDYMELFYEYAVKCIKDSKAYMCFCNEEKIKKSRAEGHACLHRSQSPEENLKLWEDFKKCKEGEAILRLKIDLEHQNTTMRDPTIFRIIDEPHARHGTKYRIWPNYDFQNSIMDGYFGITHRIRSKEFELRSELQRYIQEMLGLHITQTYEIARFNIEGVESQGRVIREKINNGEYIGWDDPRLPTIAALRRRGFQPEAIKNFVVATGITKSESTMTWDDLIIQNKRIVDKTAKRFFMMHDYERVTIEDAPYQTIRLKYHPENDEYGEREIETEKDFLILRSDQKELKEGGLYRFMDCFNFRFTGGICTFDSNDYEKFKGEGKKIMHWLPAYGNLNVEVMMDDAKIIGGVAEHNIKNVKVGEVIQFERFGFCRLDAIEKKGGNEIYKFWFTHR